MTQQFWTSVCFEGMFAGLFWVLIPEEKAVVRQEAPAPQMKLVRRDQVRVFEALNSAESTPAKLEAMARLQSMDSKALRREMRDCPEEQYQGKLSFAVKVMILRLAEIDPRAAVDLIRERWVDHDLDDDHVSQVNQTWPLVVAEWAHQDPTGLLEFWEETQKTQNHALRVYKDDLAEEMLAGNPLGFMSLYHTTDYSPVPHERFTSTLKSNQDFKAVLNTWINPTERVKIRWKRAEEEALRIHGMVVGENRSNPKKNSFAQSIISRWREVDEAGFLASEFVEWEAE